MSESRWPVHAGPSEFDPISGQLHLHHTQEDSAEGVRGHFVSILDALRCHQDAQVQQGRGLLLSYVTKYVAKWSDSSYNEWMSDAASVTSLCRKVLFEYHPKEPELALQLLGGGLFRQWDFGTVHRGVRSLRAPRPSSPEQPLFVEQYRTSTWRRENMPLLEFLRKSSSSTGAVAGWLQKLWKASSRNLSLEEFANRHRMQGEQVVAAEFLWRLNDQFYGQWCMMHIPFRSPKKFAVKNVLEKVPARYQWLATAVVLTDDAHASSQDLVGYWRDPIRIAQDMQHEAHSDGFIQDVLAFVEAQVLAIDRYLAGQLDRREEQAAADGQQAPQRGPPASLFQGKQALLRQLVQKRVDLAMQGTASAEEETWERLRAEASRKGHRPIVCSGRPGTGKTTVLHRNVHDTLAAGGSVLVTIPTARQSTRMAAKLGSHELLVVETSAAAFQFHKPEQEVMYAMHGFALVIVDEFSQLSQDQYERILRMWHAADNFPALIFAGDKYQLPGIEPTRPWHSPAWGKRHAVLLRADGGVAHNRQELLGNAGFAPYLHANIPRAAENLSRPQSMGRARSERRRRQATSAGLPACSVGGGHETRSGADQSAGFGGLAPTHRASSYVTGCLRRQPRQLQERRHALGRPASGHRRCSHPSGTEAISHQERAQSRRLRQWHAMQSIVFRRGAQNLVGTNRHRQTVAHHPMARSRSLGACVLPDPARVLHHGA